MNNFFSTHKILRYPDPEPTPGPAPAPDLSKELADLKAELAALKAKPNPAPTPSPTPEPDDIVARAAKDRAAKDALNASTEKLTKAVKFNMAAGDMIKVNASLLPSTLPGVLAQADKETYANEIEKADTLKVALVSEFFAVQANLDLLTDAQKKALAEFQALTKTVKQERVQQAYDMIFEPAFETLKRVTKAKLVNSGEIDPANADAAYAKRIADLSKAKFIKKGAK